MIRSLFNLQKSQLTEQYTHLNIILYVEQLLIASLDELTNVPLLLVLLHNLLHIYVSLVEFLEDSVARDKVGILV